MAREPQRREQPAQLSAAIKPVADALTARAAFLSLRASQRNAVNEAFIIENGPDIESAVDVRIADEFRALADELRYW
jgi:GAF domain-containing protein